MADPNDNPPSMTSEQDGNPSATAPVLPDELKDFRYEGEGDPAPESEVEPAETQEVAETEVETPETTEQQPNKGFNKALQKAQQDSAALRREMDEIKRQLAANAKAPEPAADPLDDINDVVSQFEKMGEDDIPTGKQVADALKKITASTRKALADKDRLIQEVGGQAQASAGEIRFEKTWKAENPAIAAQFESVVDKTNQYMGNKFPNLDPKSREYAAAWYTAHALITDSAKAPAKSSIPPAPSNTSRKPVPTGARPPAGKAAAVTPAARPKHNPFSDDPRDWGLGKGSQD